MIKFNPSVYRTLATGVAGATLTTSSLDAAIQIIDFGEMGIQPALPVASTTGDGGFKNFGGLFFNRAGQFSTFAGTGTGTNYSMAIAFKRWTGVNGVPSGIDADFLKFKASTGTGFVMPTLVTENAVIDQNGNFSVATYGGASGRPTASNTTATGTVLSVPSSFPLTPGESGRVGFAIAFSETEVIFGWAEVLFSPTEFSVFEIRFDDEPGVIPEVKHSALLLALGASGMAALRRRRQKAA
ncbi:MAG: hypothetical protein ACSHYA_06450 [Opitutaceae bacterium]